MPIDYDSLERLHKQDGWTQDQQYHFEAGWEAGQAAFKVRLKEIVEDLDTDMVPPSVIAGFPNILPLPAPGNYKKRPDGTYKKVAPL